MSIRAVIFDMGGVLVRTEDKAPRTRLAERYGLTYAEIDDLVFNSETSGRATVGEISAREHWKFVCSSLNYPPERYQELFAEFYAGDALDLELVNYIRSLRPRYKTAMLSNAHDDLRAYLIEHWGIEDAFDEIFVSAELGLRKPDARIYQAALKSLQVKPEEALFVDDVLENVEAARSLGMQAVQFHSSQQVRAEINARLER